MYTTITQTTARIIKRDHRSVPFDTQKIYHAILKAFLAVEGPEAHTSDRIHRTVSDLTQCVVTQLYDRYSTPNIESEPTFLIESVQDAVERTLMEHSHYEVARAYILYREARHLHRSTESQPETVAQILSLLAQYRLSTAPYTVDTQRVWAILQEACAGLPNVDPILILKDVEQSVHDGISYAQFNTALVLAARTHIETEPQYSQVTAELLLDGVRHEVFRTLYLDHAVSVDSDEDELSMPLYPTAADMAATYSDYFIDYIYHAVHVGLLSPELQTFNLVTLGNALVPERDRQFTYLGLQTLYDRYFIRHNGHCIELPQSFFMRVAMGLAMQEPMDQREEYAIRFYHVLSCFDAMSSTPTLFNSGTVRPQLSSCYLTTLPDDLDGIYSGIKDNALLSKYAGGLGNDWSSIRALNSPIRGTNGLSQGVVPFLKVVNDTAVAVNQGGKRLGAVCAYLETWHLDIEEFLELRKNTGDERRRMHDMNTANWIPDLFMERVMENGDWTLFCPAECHDLHDLYGQAFRDRYITYERMADNRLIRQYKRLPAKQLWQKMLTMLFETGHPWLTFKDPCNLRYSNAHVGVVHSSNLCTEITLHTNEDEIAVCNLASINVARHLQPDGRLDSLKLQHTVTTVMRMLDNVIDLNYYPVEKAKNSNISHRPVGLGIMGFQDALYQKRIPYASEEAVQFADESVELISYYAIKASCQLAEERGTYSTYAGSLWSQGILPIDSIRRLAAARGPYLKLDQSHTLTEWDALRDRIREHGMRNSNTMAIAPTATISNICGVSQSIEPTYQNLYIKSNLSGEFTVINPYLVNDLKVLGLWDTTMLNDLKYHDGSVQHIARIPETLKAIYATAFEIDSRWLITAAARRQKWIDQSQSLNCYVASPSGPLLDSIYKYAWLCGLKSTYYLRTLGATHVEKSTILQHRMAVESPKVCAIDNPGCESCQ